MIPPAGGDGWQYSFVAEILADEYRVITFDRRGNARSTGHEPQNFEITQQSRDAVAVLRAVGEQSAVVFGNSSGAVIALDMARTQPQAVRAVVAHEASLAALRFMLGAQLPVAKMIRATAPANRHRRHSAVPYMSDEQAAQVFIERELLPVSNYLPDISGI